MVSVCLNMIVKNEAAVIERCLAAAVPFIDAYVICDTGSTDGTPEIIKGVMWANGVPGEVHHFAFRDFAQARNEALDRARASRLPFDYLLLLDADMELVIEDGSAKDRLTDAAYLLRQEAGLSYYNVRLLRRDAPARYVGATHEYLQVDGRTQRLEGVWFIDHADGGSRGEKLRRDIRLLTEELAGDPDNARSLFYLAQSYKDAGDLTKAIEVYRRRIEVGGWQEEVWYARYMIAICQLRLGNHAEFVKASWEAYNARPSRAEPLYHLARHFRDSGLHDACLAVCEIGGRIPYPEDTLFVEREVYERGFDKEASISGFYSSLPSRKDAGREAAVALCTDRREPAEWRWLALNNASYYRRTAAELFPSFQDRRLEFKPDPGFNAHNPSIAIHDGRRWCIVRTANYDHTGGPSAESGLSAVSTRNYAVELDASLRIVSRTLVDERRDPGPVYPSIVTGFEDCRLIWRDGRPWLSCTSRDRNPDERAEIVLLELDDDWSVARVHLQRSPEPAEHQKNWMPFVYEGAIHFVYKMEPLTILRVDPASCQPEVIASAPTAEALYLFRGSSQLIPSAGGWLAVTHEVAQPRPPVRTYLHRFVRFDESLRLVGMTEPFSFTGARVEFCAGLSRDPESGRLLASYGVSDVEAHVGVVDEADVIARLRPVG